PDVPTFTEAGFDIVAENWLGVSAPAGVPDEIKATLDAALVEAMESAEVMAQFDNWGLIREPKSSGEFADYVAAQLSSWTPLVEAATQ
ncbi:tripartite tricarboxylate transporter substrate-binding protein, partial [Sulfitobacter sp. 1A09213]